MNTRSPLVRFLVPALILILTVLGTLFFLRFYMSQPHSHGEDSPLQIGSTIENLQLQKFRGPGNSTKKVSLSDLPGKIKIINFWATWCTPCIIEMPSLKKLRSRYQDQGLEVLFINLDEDPSEAVQPTLSLLEIDFSTYVDPTGEIAELFGVSSIPLTVVIDSKRKILFYEAGERDWNARDVQTEVEKWLKNSG